MLLSSSQRLLSHRQVRMGFCLDEKQRRKMNDDDKIECDNVRRISTFVAIITSC